MSAQGQRWILIANDKDFGQKVYRDGRLHKGVIWLRLEDERPSDLLASEESTSWGFVLLT